MPGPTGLKLYPGVHDRAWGLKRKVLQIITITIAAVDHT